MKRYTYMIQGSFSFQFTFSESEIDIKDDGTYVLKPKAINSLSDEIEELLGNNYAVMDVDLEEDYLLGIKNENDTDFIDWWNANDNNRWN